MGAVTEGAAIARPTSPVSAIEAIEIEQVCGALRDTAMGPDNLSTNTSNKLLRDAASFIEAAARNAEALQQEVAELREALKPFAAVEPVSISTSDGHISSAAFRRARTLLNGGSDAQG